MDVHGRFGSLRDGNGKLTLNELQQLVQATPIVAAAARGEASGTGLVGRRVDIAGKGQGKITAVKKSFGKTTRHVIRFSNGVCEELVLSKEAGRAGAKGHHFHLLD